MKKIKLFFISLSIGWAGCAEVVEPSAITIVPSAPEEVVALYTIHQGNHSTGSQSQLVETTKFSFRAKFDSTAIYNTQDPHNQADINKLMGLADCSSHHHTNSARFGWRWFGGSLEIWAYCYVDGQRNSVYLGTVTLGRYHSYSIRFEDGVYRFGLDGEEVSLNRSCTGAAKGYKLFPYFGGDEVAPHDIMVWVVEGE